MITMPAQGRPVPVPDAVDALAGSQLPTRVLLAEKAARIAVGHYWLSRGPRYPEAREYALAELAAANKVLAAYNPGLVVRTGGWSL